MSEKIKVGILGATGMVGQRFVTLLENHPWFELVTLAASAHSAGKTYEEAIGGRWKMETPMPEFVKNMVVKNVADVEDVVKNVDFVFSAVNMPKAEIRAIEEEYAKTETPVVSNNSAHRWTPDVPMVVPEINPEHYEVIEHQRKRLGTTHGFIAVKPNCSIQAYTPALAAWKEFEPREVIVSTYQAISGAGKTFNDWPEMMGNIIPFISGEEEKSEKEPLKVFGHVDEEKGEIVPFDGALKRAVDVDVIVTSTGAPHYVVKPWETRQLMTKRKGRPLFFIDIAVPRDVDPEVAGIKGVTLYNIDALEAVVDEHKEERLQEAKLAHAIVEEEVKSIEDKFQYLSFRPLMALLSERCERIRQREVRRASSKLPDLTKSERRQIEHMTRMIVRKILRMPMMKLNASAGTAQESFYIEAMRALFKLDTIGEAATSEERHNRYRDAKQ